MTTHLKAKERRAQERARTTRRHCDRSDTEQTNFTKWPQTTHSTKLKHVAAPVTGQSAQETAEQAVNADVAALVAQGRATYLDNHFYQQFAGLSFQDVPLNIHFQQNNLGRCFDCSALLALALDGKDGRDYYVCRGVLQRLNASFKRAFQHGWVEHRDQVYDTTWHVCMDKDTYYQLFAVQPTVCLPTAEFFAQERHPEQWQLRSITPPTTTLSPVATPAPEPTL